MIVIPVMKSLVTFFFFRFPGQYDHVCLCYTLSIGLLIVGEKVDIHCPCYIIGILHVHKRNTNLQCLE